MTEPLTYAEIAELRRLHDGVIAQDTEWARRNGQPIYPENVAFMVACNNWIGPLLEEVTRSRDLLRRLEWDGIVPDPMVPYEYDIGCPACEALKSDGKHESGCELAALIGGK